MTPTLVFYQLLVVALGLLCCMIQVGWPDTPRRKRSTWPPGGQPWRQLQGVACHGYFYATRGTIFPSQRSSPELIGRVSACLAEVLGMRGTSQGFEIDPHTVRQWLGEAAEQLHAWSVSCLHDVHLNQV